MIVEDLTVQREQPRKTKHPRALPCDTQPRLTVLLPTNRALSSDGNLAVFAHTLQACVGFFLQINHTICQSKANNVKILNVSLIRIKVKNKILHLPQPPSIL